MGTEEGGGGERANMGKKPWERTQDAGRGDSHKTEPTYPVVGTTQGAPPLQQVLRTKGIPLLRNRGQGAAAVGTFWPRAFTQDTFPFKL